MFEREFRFTNFHTTFLEFPLRASVARPESLMYHYPLDVLLESSPAVCSHQKYLSSFIFSLYARQDERGAPAMHPTTMSIKFRPCVHSAKSSVARLLRREIGFFRKAPFIFFGSKYEKLKRFVWRHCVMLSLGLRLGLLK